MRKSCLSLVAALGACVPFAHAQRTLVGPVGFVHLDPVPGAQSPDEVVGPPGFVWAPNTLFGEYNLVPEVERFADGPLGFDAQTVHPPAPAPVDAFTLMLSDTLQGAFGGSARVSIELRVADLDRLTSFQVRDPALQMLGGRIAFGRGCFVAGACATPLDFTDFHYLAPGPGAVAGHQPLRVCTDAFGNAIPGCVPPEGYAIGDRLPAPVDAWFRLSFESVDPFVERVYVDYLDGAGPILAGEFSSIGFQRSIAQIALRTPDATIGSLVRLRNVSGAGLVATCPGDANADGMIGFADLNLVLTNFGAVADSGFPFGDVTNDGVVDFADLNALLPRFGTVCD